MNRLHKTGKNHNKHKSIEFEHIEIMWADGLFEKWVKFSSTMALDRKELSSHYIIGSFHK